MSGWKTKLAAGLSILYGIGGWLLDLHGLDYIVTGIGGTSTDGFLSVFEDWSGVPFILP